ncbi:MAG: hypothetical protein ACI395_01570 [Candidatus Cryptobacteroides sp.]
MLAFALPFVALLLLPSCNTDTSSSTGDGPGDEEVLPEPPEQADESNVFIVDFFTALDAEGDFFARRDVGVASQYVNDLSGKRPVAVMFDRTDFTVGKPSPMTSISYATGWWPFFAQSSGLEDGVVKGTGIVTPYTVSDYGGCAVDGAYMSGCLIPLPLSTATKVYVSTAGMMDAGKMASICSVRLSAMSDNVVVIGTVPAGDADALAKYAVSVGLRMALLGSEGTALDLFVLTPAEYVCRSMEQNRRVNLPYYRISIEKWK